LQRDSGVVFDFFIKYLSSCLSQNGTGDANDVWKILITNGRDGDVVETVTSKLKFVHYLHHCVLTCSGKTLPKWLVTIDITLNFKSFA